MLTLLSWILGLKWVRLPTTLISFFSASILAAPFITPSDQTDIEQKQAELLNEAKKNQQSLQELIELKGETKETVSEANEPCFEISVVRLIGADKLTTQEKQLVLKPYQSRCLGLTAINQLLKNVTNFYIQQGYITSRAFLAEQDLSSGILEITVIEGKLEKILLNNTPSRQLDLIFPGVVGKILNLRDLEQGLEQLNRLASNNARIQLQPGKQPGYTIVNINNTPGQIWQLTTGFDNSGQKSTGDQQVLLDIKIDDLLGLYEQLGLTAKKSADFAQAHDAENLGFMLAVPYGYWGLSYHFSYSNYQTTLFSNLFPMGANGNTRHHRVKLQRGVHRDSTSKTQLGFELAHRRDRNYLMGSLLTSSSRNLTDFSLNLTYSTRFKAGFLTLSPALNRGVSWFGAEQDTGKHPASPQAEYNKATLFASFILPLTNQLSYATSAYGQWTDNTLYGSQRISLGGEYSVRGFKQQSISGDRGFYWRNEVNTQLLNSPDWGLTTAILALDIGALHPDKSDPFERGQLTGSAFGLGHSYKRLHSSLMVGAPIHSPSWLKTDSYSLYYRINIKI